MTLSVGPGVLSREGLIESASREAQLDDFGDVGFLEPLDRWVDAVNTEAGLSETGVFALTVHAVRLLVNRLRMQADVVAHPEILDEYVSDPIVITGLARTGTTKLQRMLSADPGFQALCFWRVYNPGRFPNGGAPEVDPRIGAADEYVGAITALYPEMMAAHPTSAHEADEDTYLLELTFDSLITSVRAHTPSFYRWWRDRSRDASYAYERRLLQYLQWQDGGRKERRWVLKSPVHLGALDIVLNTFPNATLVQCHRDPVVAIASTARMLEVARMLVTASPNPVTYGEETMEWWEREMNANLAIRDRLGARDDVVDVGYTDILKDPMVAIQPIYERSGVQLAPVAVQAMQNWADDNPQNRFGKHEYSLGRYGLTTERVRDAFSGYLDRFGSLAEA